MSAKHANAKEDIGGRQRVGAILSPSTQEGPDMVREEAEPNLL